EILAELDSLDDARLHVVVLDLGLAGLEAVGGGEGDGDARVLSGECRISEPEGHQGGHGGAGPDRRDMRPALQAWRQEPHGFSPALSHIRRGSKALAAKMVMTTTAAKAR